MSVTPFDAEHRLIAAAASGLSARSSSREAAYVRPRCSRMGSNDAIKLGSASDEQNEPETLELPPKMADVASGACVDLPDGLLRPLEAVEDRAEILERSPACSEPATEARVRRPPSSNHRECLTEGRLAVDSPLSSAPPRRSSSCSFGNDEALQDVARGSRSVAPDA